MARAADTPPPEETGAARAFRGLLAVSLLGGPVVLAFHDGGYYDGPRAVATIVAWALVGVAAIVAPWPGRPARAADGAPSRGHRARAAIVASWPGRPARAAALALGGLAALTLWAALSSLWAPLEGPALDAVTRNLLYLAVLALGLVAWRSRAALRAVEPALAAGALVVVGYGLAGRLLPDLVEIEPSAGAGGRLEQPLAYWNAMGALAAIGLVLCVRVAGDATRPARLRTAAVAASICLATGLYLSFSRGAIAATLAGLVMLAVLAPSREQWRACAVVALAGVVAAIASSLYGAFESLSGSAADARAQGAVMIAVLALLAVGAAVTALPRPRGESAGHEHLLPVRFGRVVAAAAAVVVLALPLVAAVIEGGPRTGSTGASAERLRDFGSNRYSYWRVALDEAADHPLNGSGAGSFEVAWRRERTIGENVRDAHSLVLETAAELGLVGLLALAALFGGIGLAVVSLQRSDPTLGAGMAAGLATWAVHANLDWDWEMPALTLVAIVLAGAALAAVSYSPASGSSARARLRAAAAPAGSRSRSAVARTSQAP